MKKEPDGWRPAVVVPNTSNTLLVVFWLEDDKEAACYEHLPIIAWSITLDIDGVDVVTRPILVEDVWDEENVQCFEVHVGEPRWIFPGDRTVTSLDEARVYATEQMRRREQTRALRLGRARGDCAQEEITR